MNLLLVTPRADSAALWRELIEAHLPGAQLQVWPEVAEPDRIEVALAWKAPRGVLAGLPSLRLIYSLGMGVDHLLDEPTCPAHVPIVRLVDPEMTAQMSEYALYAVLHFHRRFDDYDRFQREARWNELDLTRASQCAVGIMGLGAVGAHCAARIASLGFRVSGWSRTVKSVEGVRCLAGQRELAEFLGAARILVCALPATPSTAGIVCADTLRQLPPGAYFVNVARGTLVVEHDLLAALDSGQLAGAMLDVTRIEPLPATSRLWCHPKVRITPHIAGLTNPRTAIRAIVENLRRLRAGEPLLDVVDRTQGY